MRLTKIQNFLKENNIDYDISIKKYKNNEFGDITIKNDSIKYCNISEFAGNSGNTVSGIIISYRDNKSGKNKSFILTSQTEIIKRLRETIK